jgi:hypothetical protein
VQDDDDEDKAKRANASLPPSVVEAAINSIMERNNYGLDAPGSAKLPAALAAWRWEVKAEFKDWLPKSGRDKADARLEERKQVRVLILTAQLRCSHPHRQNKHCSPSSRPCPNRSRMPCLVKGATQRKRSERQIRLPCRPMKSRKRKQSKAQRRRARRKPSLRTT